MTVRFQCSACAQPIEVDDDWAAKPVTCPYCRRTITAPSESTLSDPACIPVATPLAPQVTAPIEEPMPAAVYAPQIDVPFAGSEHPNRIAVVALILACIAVFAVFGVGFASAPHADDLKAMTERAQTLEKEGKNPITAQQIAMGELLDKDGLPTWLVVTSVGYCMLPLLWISALVCGVIGVRRVRRRGMAIAALTICGSIVLLMCAGMILAPI